MSLLFMQKLMSFVALLGWVSGGFVASLLALKFNEPENWSEFAGG
jgi:hypothetical protein